MLTPALSALLLFQLLSGLLVAPLLSLFPVYVEGRLHLPPTFTGNLRSLFVVLGGVMGFAGGQAVNALGRKPAYLLGMTGVLVGGLLFLSSSPNLMLLLGVYGGLAFGLGAVSGQSYLMDSVEKRSLGLATAFYFMTGTAGNALGNLVAGRVARLPEGYALLGWSILVGQAVLIAAGIRFLPALPRPDGAGGLRESAGGFRRLLARREVWLLLVVRFAATVYWGVATLLLPLLLFRLTGSPAAAADYTAASLVVSALCQVAMGRLVDQRGARGLVVGAVSLMTLAAVAKGLLAGQPAALVAFGVLGAGAAWSLSVSMPTLIRELTTGTERAALLGIAHMAWSGGFVVGTLLAARLASAPGGPEAAFLTAAGACLAATAAAVLVVRHRLVAQRMDRDPLPAQVAGEDLGSREK